MGMQHTCTHNNEPNKPQQCKTGQQPHDSPNGADNGCQRSKKSQPRSATSAGTKSLTVPTMNTTAHRKGRQRPQTRVTSSNANDRVHTPRPQQHRANNRSPTTHRLNRPKHKAYAQQRHTPKLPKHRGYPPADSRTATRTTVVAPKQEGKYNS